MKKTISATIDKELVTWIEKQLKKKHQYRNKSHLVEIAIELLRQGQRKK